LIALLVSTMLAWSGPAILSLGGTTVTAEVADTPQERAVGLMGRFSLAPDSGMLFVYPDEAVRSFWMKNTPLPLSIAYLSRSGKIVHIASMKPLSEEPVSSVHPTMYALEMTEGWFAEHNVKVGQSVGGLPEPARQ
tara:strand:- start:270 stop:677 length:408 start_codon:yes stop_codon:yes gene_type:complete